jgi:hypothetical protein
MQNTTPDSHDLVVLMPQPGPPKTGFRAAQQHGSCKWGSFPTEHYSISALSKLPATEKNKYVVVFRWSLISYLVSFLKMLLERERAQRYVV